MAKLFSSLFLSLEKIQFDVSHISPWLRDILKAEVLSKISENVLENLKQTNILVMISCRILAATSSSWLCAMHRLVEANG